MISYVIDKGLRLVKAKMTGATDLVGLVTHIANLSRDPLFDPSYNLIFEVATDATFSLLPVEAEFHKLMKQWTTRRKGVKWAFWVPFGTTHTHVEFALGMLSRDDIQTRLFETEPEAMQWLTDPATT